MFGDFSSSSWSFDINQFIHHNNEWIFIFAGHCDKPIDSIESFKVGAENEWIEESTKVLNGRTKFAAVAYT